MGKPLKNSNKTNTGAGGWRPDLPHNRLAELPPPGDLESHAVLKRCIAARAALGELKEAAKRIPNQAVLIYTLPLLESQASSAIENIVTTTDRLFQHQQQSEHADPATKEALRYSQALLEGFQSLARSPLTTQTAEEVCTKIKGVEMRVRRVPGTALAKESGELVYTPPEGEDLLRSMLANWERFLHNQQEIDPLVRMAVGHYQFEAIHPFTDGNGRTGRVLNSLFLISEGLLTLPILYLSRYIIENKEEYYRLLLDVTRQETWEDWLLFMIQGIEQTAHWTKAKIDAIDQLLQHTSEYARQRLGRKYSYELMGVIFQLPYSRIQNVVEQLGTTRQTASRLLKQLMELGVLEERAEGREKLFIHAKLLSLLTRDDNDFAPYE
ncbi:MAG: protein adenylyltransferase Fic [Bythopirellula sp.]